MSWTLVTGGSRGLGATLCSILAQKGHNIALQYRVSKEAAEGIVQQCQALGVQAYALQGDFSTPQGVNLFLNSYLEQCTETRAVINNASEYHLGTASETPPSIWQHLFQVNLHAPIAIINALLPSLRRNQGAILNLGVAGLVKQHADTHASGYFSSKSALWSVTRSWAKEEASHLISCNMISPGYLETSEDHPMSVDRLPMQRLASLNEVSRLIAFLLEEENSYITGQNIEISGGVRL